MGKEGELWDDSALINAFGSALSKYKVMHGISESPEVEVASTGGAVPDNRSNEDVQVDDNNESVPLTTERFGENGCTTQVLENPTVELVFSAEHLGSSSSNIQNGICPPNNASVAAQSCPSENQTSQNESVWSPSDQEQYNLLWSKYYEIENQRQKIIQQLNDYSSYQTYDTSTIPSEEHQGSVPQPYDTVTCSCPYGCQNWVVPGYTIPACTAASKGVPAGTSVTEEDPTVKTAMNAAERALSSLMKEDIFSAGSAIGGKDKEVGVERDHIDDSTNSATDLAVVLKSWYSAGFYTGKYISEQSFEKKTSVSLGTFNSKQG